MFQIKIVEKIKACLLCSKSFFFFWWHLFGYEEKYCRASHATDGSMVAHVHCLLDKEGYKTHSEYVILIAFPLQQWLHECMSMFHCT